MFSVEKNQEKNKNIWSVIPGKFTLAFSIAPEFYRLIYNKNPRKFFDTSHEESLESLVDETVWGEVQNKLG